MAETSSGDKIEDPKAIDFLNSIDEVIDFVREIGKRKIGLVQARIVINRNHNEIIDKLNTFLIEMNHSPEVKIGTVLAAIPKVSSIISSLPHDESFDITEMNWISLSNFLRMQIAWFQMESDDARMITSANLLSQLLMGDVPYIKELPEFPEITSDPFPFLDKLIPVQNALISVSGVYESLISFLTNVDYSDLIEWSNSIFHHYDLYWKAVDLIDITKILETKKIKKMQTFYSNMVLNPATLGNLINLLTLLFAKLGGIQIEELNGEGLFRYLNLQSISDVSQRVIDLSNKVNEELESAYKNRLVNLNDKLNRNEFYGSYALSIAFVEYTVQEVKLYQLYEKERKFDIFQVNQLISKGESILKDSIELVGGLENLPTSYFKTYVFLVFKMLIPLYAVKTIQDNEPKFLDNKFYEYRDILTSMEADQDAELLMIRILSLLYTKCELGTEINFKEMINTLLSAREVMKLKPRIYIASSILSFILCFFVDEEQSDLRPQLLTELVEFGVIEGEQPHLEIEINGYINQLKLIMDNQDGNFEMFKERTKLIPFDTFSWLVPNFKKLCKLRGINILEYIPFNLAKDSVLYEDVSDIIQN